MIPRRLPWTADTWARLPPLAARGVHAVLLHGQRGIGKISLALDFAEALLCAAPLPDHHRCGRCDECRLTEAFGHPDLRWVLPQVLAEQLLPQPEEPDDDAESPPEAGEGDGKAPKASREIRVEQVRGLSDFLGIASFRGGRRAVLIAPTEAMNAVAANTLLKMLEEPPPRTMFVLVSHALDEVLPTIRSRCVLVQVPVPDPQQCIPWLSAQGVAEPADTLALASGAPLAAIEQVAAGADAAALYRLLDAGPSLTGAQIVAAVGRDVPLAASVRLMQCWAFDLLSCRLLRTVRYHPQRLARLSKIAEAASADRLWDWIASLRSAAAVREHPLNARLVIESLLVSYAQIFAGRR